MSENSKIAWTNHTFNPWIGCTQVSPGCAYCYAELLMDRRYGRVKWGKGQARSRTSVQNWNQVRRWDRAAEKSNERPLVFCASLADWLDEEVPIEWLVDLLGLIRETPNIIWLLLTKRPKNWRERIELAACLAEDTDQDELDNWLCAWLSGLFAPENVWIGVTIEDQNRMLRHATLMEIPARVHWWSAEPLLENLDVRAAWSTCGAPDWVIIGCESHGKTAGRNAVTYAHHAYHIIDQCREAGVRVFNKQIPLNGIVSHEPDEWPVGLRLREFPEQKEALAA